MKRKLAPLENDKRKQDEEEMRRLFERIRKIKDDDTALALIEIVRIFFSKKEL